MAPTLANPKRSTTKSQRQDDNPGTTVVRAERRRQQSPAVEGPADLPSRQALTARLEAQRKELLRVMSAIGLAQRTLEEHIPGQASRGAPPIASKEQEPYRRHVLDALNDATEALRAAYPMLERIAQALAVEEILKQQTLEQSQAPTASRAGAHD